MKRMDGWGVTGWSNEWTALGTDEPIDDDATQLEGYGVKRTVDPGVVYAAGPAMPGVPAWHARRVGKGRVFEMEWPEHVEPASRSLLDIQASLASRRKTLMADDPDLAMLDAAVDGLLAAAAALHAKGFSLGYLQPDSCRCGTTRDGKPFVVLPDVGFAWDKRSGLMLPQWIAKPQLAQLFEDGAERRNDDYLAELARQKEPRDLRRRNDEDAASDLADVKLVARLVAAALVGADEMRRWCAGKKFLTTLPVKDAAPDTQAEIWDKVIAPALDGHVATCEELRVKLAVYKPSSHYLHVPPTPPWSGWPVVRRVAIGAAAACVLGLLWLCSDPILAWIKTTLIGAPAPFCRVVAKEDPLYAKLFALKDAREAARGDVSKQPAFWAQLEECRTDHAALAACGRDCLAELVDEWARQAEQDGLAVRERLRSRPRPTPDEIRDVSAAIESIRTAASEAKRPAASFVVKMLERDLRLRGGVPAEVPDKPPQKRSD
jgi:hypothetical protein